MNLDILLRGQSNAVLFDSDGGLAELKAQLQALLGFDGRNNTITLVSSYGGSSNTMNAGTAFLTDWVAPKDGDWTQGWTTGSLEQGLLDAIGALSPAVKASPTAVVWLHNEYDGAQAGLTAAKWESALRYDAALVRQALGQSAAQVPYFFVNAIPYSSANWDSNQQIRIGMQELAADAAFHAEVAAQSHDLNMDASNTAMGGPHIGAEDALTLATRLARSLAESFAGYAQPGSPVALAGGALDDAGPQVIAAAAVAGHANQLLLTIGFDHAETLLPLDSVAASGANWFVNTSVAASGGQWATAAQLLDGNHLLLTFASPLAANSLVFYGYGYGKVWAPDGTGEGHGIYDNNGMPLWTSATGVAVSGSVTPPAASTVSGLVGSGPDRLVLRISQDAYAGDALYTVKVDGVQVGGTFTAHALHGQQPSDTLTLAGSWGGGDHQVVVTFLNDAWAGTPQTDRNLYVDGISLNGVAAANGTAALLSAGPASFDLAAGGQLDGSRYSLVWREDFSQQTQLNYARFPVAWGRGNDFVFADGALTLTSYASEGWGDVGFMQYASGATAGQGYGLYSATASLDAAQGLGICLVLWPADNVWPGPELDLLESWDATRQSGFATIHWKGADGADQYDIHGFSVDLTQRHSYALDWQPGRLTYYIDGVVIFTTTQHVPLDAAHGGINAAFGAEVTAAGSSPVSDRVSLHLYEMSYAAPVAATAAPNGTTIEALGATTLLLSGGHYLLLDGSGAGPVLTLDGHDVTVGQFGAWQPIAAEAVGGGYLVAWQNGGQFFVWTVDAAGHYTGAATAVVAGTDAALERLETSFRQDLNGDGSIGLPTTVIEALGATRLVQLGPNYALQDSNGAGPLLAMAGTAVAAGPASGWHPLAAEANGGGYLVAWQHGAADQFIVWQTDASGNYSGTPTGVVRGTDAALEALEPSFGLDLNGDGSIGLPITVIEALGATRLVQSGPWYALQDGNGAGPLLSIGGATVSAGQFGAWHPVAAEAANGGYRVAWQNGATFFVWNVDAAGHFTSAASAVLHGTDAMLQSLEVSFGQDLNGDGSIGLPTLLLEAAGTTQLVQQGAGYFLLDQNDTGPLLTLDGAAVTPGQFGPWHPVAAEAVQGGYLVAWQNGAQFFVWNVDAAGHYASPASAVLRGNDSALQRLEGSFQQDLNGDGRIGPQVSVIEALGLTKLVQLGDAFALRDAQDAGPMLHLGGQEVTAGQFGGWHPVAAEAQLGGYLVAWQNGNQFFVWAVDGAGDYASPASAVLRGSDPVLQAMEPLFQQDLNGDGHLGLWIG